MSILPFLSSITICSGTDFTVLRPALIATLEPPHAQLDSMYSVTGMHDFAFGTFSEAQSMSLTTCSCLRSCVRRSTSLVFIFRR